MARESDGEDKKRGAQCCRYGHQEGSPATGIHGESFALPPNGLRFSGEPSERSERPARKRGQRVRCNDEMDSSHRVCGIFVPTWCRGI